MEWEPIETEEKTSADRLIYVEDTREMFVAFWDGGGWQFAICGGNCKPVQIKSPTHWMPLPSPPSA